MKNISSILYIFLVIGISGIFAQEHIGSGYPCENSGDCRVESRQICVDKVCECQPIDVETNNITVQVSWDSHFQRCVLAEDSLCYMYPPRNLPKCAKGTRCLEHSELPSEVDQGTCQLLGSGETCQWADNELTCRTSQTGQLCLDGKCQCPRFDIETQGIEMKIEFANEKCGLTKDSLCFMRPSKTMLKCSEGMQCSGSENIDTDLYGQGTCQ